MGVARQPLLGRAGRVGSVGRVMAGRVTAGRVTAGRVMAGRVMAGRAGRVGKHGACGRWVTCLVYRQVRWVGGPEEARVMSRTRRHS